MNRQKTLDQTHDKTGRSVWNPATWSAKNSKQIKTVFWVQDDREPASTQQFISLSPTDETLTRPKGNKKKKYPNIGYVSLA